MSISIHFACTRKAHAVIYTTSLDKLEEAYRKKYPNKPFQRPRNGTAAATVFVFSLPAGSSSIPAENPKLAEIRRRFSDPWIFDACEKGLNHLGLDPEIYDCAYTVKDRLRVFPQALTELNQYPKRPVELLPPSPSVDALRMVLSEAPYKPEDGGECPRDMELIEDGASGDSWYKWSDAYTDRLFVALAEVIRAHGVGENGWESARWEVYDKVKPLSLT